MDKLGLIHRFTWKQKQKIQFFFHQFGLVDKIITTISAYNTNFNEKRRYIELNVE